MSAPTPTISPKQAQESLEALLNGPAGTPPPGVMPNFNIHNDMNGFMTLTVTLGIGFATLAILLRFCTKAFLIRSIAYEDYAVVLGWLGLIGMVVPCMNSVKSGGGLHMWDMRLKNFFRLLYWVNMTSIFYDITVFFIKLSITLQLLRIFVPNRKGNLFLFYGLQACIWTNLLFYLINMSILIAMCRPREKIWNPLLPGHCYNPNPSYLASGFFNVISDFAILILPLPTLWGLQLPLRRKILLTLIFATGLFACITSILRTYYTMMLVRTPDVSYFMVRMGLWTLAEVSIGVIVSCLPVIPKFFQHIGPQVYKTFSFGSKPEDTSEHMPRPFQIGLRSKDDSKFKPPSAKSRVASGATKTWDDPYCPRAQVSGEYITLDDQQTGMEISSLSKGSSSEMHCTKRDDLEKGAWNVGRSQ